MLAMLTIKAMVFALLTLLYGMVAPEGWTGPIPGISPRRLISNTSRSPPTAGPTGPPTTEESEEDTEPDEEAGYLHGLFWRLGRPLVRRLRPAKRLWQTLGERGGVLEVLGHVVLELNLGSDRRLGVGEVVVANLAVDADEAGHEVVGRPG